MPKHRSSPYALFAVVSFVAIVALVSGCGSDGGSGAKAAGVAPAKATGTTAGPTTTTTAPTPPPAPKPLSENRSMTRTNHITGDISPKSVVASGHGLVSAQNMMYRHTVTFYDADGALVKSLPDAVTLSDFGFADKQGSYQGAPVEAAYSPDGKYVYVSNYAMYGPGYGPEGSDECGAGNAVSPSTVYRINTKTLAVDGVVAVGATPKYVAVTPDNRYLLVSNWCGYDVSVIDLQSFTEVTRIKVGAYPRGIAIEPQSKTAYVAVMGTRDIAKIDLTTMGLGWIRNVGAAPRHIVMDPLGRYIYVTLNGEGKVAKIDLGNDTVVTKVATGRAPRSMAISTDGTALYVVNYESNDVSKLRSSDMTILQTLPTDGHPIGITYEPMKDRVWVACYSGSLIVFDDA